MVAARARSGGRANLRFELADAASFAHPDGPADLIVSRHGVMFFSDPPAAFAQMAQAAAPGARIVFSCFRSASENLWASGVAALLPPAEPTAPQAFPAGPFAFADPDHVRRCMAGWTDLVFTPVDFTYVAGEGADPVADALDFFRRIGPAAAAMRALPESARASFEDRLAAFVREHRIGARVTFPAAAWIVTATVGSALR